MSGWTKSRSQDYWARSELHKIKTGKTARKPRGTAVALAASPAHTVRADLHLFAAFERWFKKLSSAALSCRCMLPI